VPARIFARLMRAGLAGEPVEPLPLASPDDLDLDLDPLEPPPAATAATTAATTTTTPTTTTAVPSEG
ncbi:MAG: hypothetical protein ACRDY7_10970, partial [Acidimicrobiia bacterium]